MYAPNSTFLTQTPATPTILAAALTDPTYVPVTRMWAGDSAQTAIIPEGTIVAQFVTGSNAGMVGEYDPAATDGTEIPTGILHSPIEVGQLYTCDASGTKTAVNTPVTVFMGGSFIAANLTGFDPAAEALLGGTTDMAGVFSF